MSNLCVIIVFSTQLWFWFASSDDDGEPESDDDDDDDEDDDEELGEEEIEEEEEEDDEDDKEEEKTDSSIKVGSLVNLWHEVLFLPAIIYLYSVEFFLSLFIIYRRLFAPAGIYPSVYSPTRRCLLPQLPIPRQIT